MSDNPSKLEQALSQIKNETLRAFVSYNAWERGHSAGEDEVAMIAEGLAYDLKKVDDYITHLEQLAGI